LLRFEPRIVQTHSLTSVLTALSRLLNDGDGGDNDDYDGDNDDDDDDDDDDDLTAM
jgi:hypothetical protein